MDIKEVTNILDSLDSMIRYEDFLKFVLFKAHYRKYMEIHEEYEGLLAKYDQYQSEVQQLRAALVEGGTCQIRCDLQHIVLKVADQSRR
ncbi:unnamed protein product [Darwinula stevensoni]|uniref:Uncharacterized protein n=1 Tax=Darwinula stevensoni TaxID=69355 RepID=A0A7R9AAM2_9CRUS|nr:unnamed protein product [Darwinula stevensoni]CAG0898374.1 unnamed protein product [Darwinula stevensoni]